MGGGRRLMVRGRPPARRSLRPCHEPPPRDIEIRQPAADIQPVRILCQPPIPYFDPAKDPLDHQERVLDFRPDFRLGAVASPLLLAQRPMAMRVCLNETLGLGGMLLNYFTLSTVGRVAPYPRLLAMQ